MLRIDAPFPQPGSYALLDADGDTHLVRIHQSLGLCATVTFPLRPGSAGTRTVDFADLADISPLNAAEEIELAELDRRRHGPFTRARARQLELSGRREAAARAAPLLERLRRLEGAANSEPCPEHSRAAGDGGLAA